MAPRAKSSFWFKILCSCFLVAGCSMVLLLAKLNVDERISKHITQESSPSGDTSQTSVRPDVLGNAELLSTQPEQVDGKTDSISEDAIGAPNDVFFQSTPAVQECTLQHVSLRIRVLLVPSQLSPKWHTSRVEAVRETWGHDMIFKLTDGRCVAWEVSLAHEGSAFEEPKQLKPFVEEATPPPEVQRKGKASALRYNLIHAFSQTPSPDWLFKVDDCVFVIPENAVALFARYDPGMPVLLGSHLRNGAGKSGTLFTSSAGFALSRGALHRIRDIESNPSAFEPSVVRWFTTSFVRMPADVGLSGLCQQLDVEMPDTRDQAGAERFNAFPIPPSVKGAYHDWFVRYKQQAGQAPLSGPGCCAADAVLFHYVGGVDIRFLQDLLRGPWFAIASNEERVEKWPKPGESLFDQWDRKNRPRLDRDNSEVWSVLEKLQAQLKSSDVVAVKQ